MGSHSLSESGSLPTVRRTMLNPLGLEPVPDSSLETRFLRVRSASERLVDPLSPEDACGQSMPCCSPAKWHLAHTTWFFETFVLERFEPVTAGRFEPVDPRFRAMFNSYYRSVGVPMRRDQRGLMTRPPLEDVLEYREAVDERVAAVLSGSGDFGIESKSELEMLIEVGIRHEQQHQELLLADVKHLLSLNPLRPVYASAAVDGPDPREGAGRMSWRSFAEGLRRIGICETGAEGFSYDNERPAHRVFVHGFDLADRLVTNGEYLEFIADGGYERAELWLDAGWSHRRERGIEHPLYWRKDGDGRWLEFTLTGERELCRSEPVCHVGFYEAEAFARWAGARLPTEQEWESAARESGAAADEAGGVCLETGALHPAPAVAAVDGPLRQMLGDVWEWTRSDYGPYPGYTAPEGALGEYNGKFMSGQYVLRGGCCVTPRGHASVTYRNFYAPGDRWQFGGIRLARDTGT